MSIVKGLTVGDQFEISDLIQGLLLNKLIIMEMFGVTTKLTITEGQLKNYGWESKNGEWSPILTVT